MQTFKLGLKDILDADWDTTSHDVVMQAEGIAFNYNLSTFLSPIFGNFWRVLYAEGDFEGIKSALHNYYKYISKPNIIADVIIAKNEEDNFLIRTKSLGGGDGGKEKAVVDINVLLKDINKWFPYNSTVVGSNGSHVEFQFLDTTNRIDASKNDFIDPGLFVSVNGKVQVSPGLNRLICTNGLVERYHDFGGKEYKFGDEFLKRGVELMKWLVEQQRELVPSVKELSVVTHCLPSPMTTKYWKEWSQGIEERKLTYYDVIDNITSYANKHVDSTRNRILSFPAAYAEYKKNGACPVCHSDVSQE
jgi:hypothetical protein